MVTLDAFKNLLRVAEAITDFEMGWDKCISGHLLRDPWFIQQGLRSGKYYTPTFSGEDEFRALLKFFGYAPEIHANYEKWFDHPIRQIFGWCGTLAERIEAVRTTLETLSAKSNIDSTSPGATQGGSGD